MATSSSDGSCAAPADFQLSSELEDANYPRQESLSTNLLKCPLCYNAHRIFYCRQCIQNGDFVHSTTVYSERFADKQLKLLRLKDARSQLEEKCKALINHQKLKDTLASDINYYKEQMRVLQALIHDTNQDIHRGNQRLNVLKDLNHQLSLRMPKHEERMEKIQRYIDGLSLKRENQTHTYHRKRSQLKKLIKSAMKQLVHYIFPMEKSKGDEEEDDNSDQNTDLVKSALADASSTLYIKGQWINNVDNDANVSSRVLVPSLPKFKLHSAYALLDSKKKDFILLDSKKNDLTHSIAASLTYTAQLVNIIAYYVNVRLPYKVNHGEFCTIEVTDQKFARKIARLNSNLLYLCLTQNTNVNVLRNAANTVENLMNLLNSEVSDMGRSGPIEADPQIVLDLYNQLLPDLEASDDSASEEEEDTFNWEWEAVPNTTCDEAIIADASLSSQHASSYQVNQSMTGGLVTSAAASLASIWRWTTNKQQQ